MPVVRVTTAKGITKTVVFGDVPARPKNYTYYTIQAGDRFEIIAFKTLGDPRLWWKIANANPEVFYPEQLQTGAVIRIPA